MQVELPQCAEPVRERYLFANGGKAMFDASRAITRGPAPFAAPGVPTGAWLFVLPEATYTVAAEEVLLLFDRGKDAALWANRKALAEEKQDLNRLIWDATRRELERETRPRSAICRGADFDVHEV